MAEMIVKFKVSMDTEQKALGNSEEVEFTVTTGGVSEEYILEKAIKARIISWQSNLKAHWSEFLEMKDELKDKVIPLDEQIIQGTRGGNRKPKNADEALKVISGLSNEAKAALVEQLMKSL